MKQNERLLAAIGEIDDRIIEEAERWSGRGGIPLYKRLSVAASVLIVSIGIIGSLLIFTPVFDGDLAGDAAPEMPDKNEEMMNGVTNQGGTMQTSFGTLRLLARDGESYTFELTLTEQMERQDITLRGSGYDQWGEPIFVISTTAPFAELTHIPVEPPRLKINGADADTLPTAPGEYTVEVDFSPLTEAGYTPDEYFVFGDFGRISR